MYKIAISKIKIFLKMLDHFTTPGLLKGTPSKRHNAFNLNITDKFCGLPVPWQYEHTVLLNNSWLHSVYSI